MKTLSLVIPCHNEFRRLNPEAFLAAMEKRAWLSFCFVDDGSTDATAERLAHLENLSPSIHVIYLPRNMGKAEAVRTGMRYLCECSHSDLLGFWDADLATPLDEIDGFVRRFEESPGLETVIGSRWPHLGSSIHRGVSRSLTGALAKALIRKILGFYVWDTQCGAKVFARETAKEIFEHPFRTHWLFDVELLLRLGRHRLATCACEMPLASWHDVPGSKIGIAEMWRISIELINMVKCRHAHIVDRG